MHCRAPAVAALLFPLIATARAQDLAGQLDALCQPLIDGEVVVGLAVGVVDGEARLVRGFGHLETGRGAAPTSDTLFEIGSISKVFTGLLFADAVERGLVAAEDPVQKYLPAGVKMPTALDREVLLWHLVTHTSGLPRLPAGDPPNPADPYAHLTAEKLYALLAETPLRNEPGKVYEYSNLGAGLLGQLLVDRNGARSYDELLRARIATPLGLADTLVRLDEKRQPRLAPPHDSEGDPGHTWELAALAGAGGIHSTVDDLLKLAHVQIAPADGGGLAAAITRSQQRLHDLPGGQAIAWGWHIAKDGVTLWHNGETGGYHGYFAVQPSLHRAVCLLANSPRADIDAVGEMVLQHLAGQAIRPLKFEAPVAVDREVLQRYVGWYQMVEGIEFEITLRERGLYAQLSRQPAFRLYPRSATEFFYRVVPASITFEVENDEAKALVLHQDGRDRRCQKIAVAVIKRK